RDVPLALRQRVTGGAAPPRADTERTQPFLRQLAHGLRAALLRGSRHGREDVLGTCPIALCKRNSEVESRPERVEAEAELLRSARGGLKRLRRRWVDQE